VVHEGRPMLIVAGAGSGKEPGCATPPDRVTCRSARPVQPQHEILAIHVHQQAAGEMAARVRYAARFRPAKRRSMWGQEVPLDCVRILRRESETVGTLHRSPSRDQCRIAAEMALTLPMSSMSRQQYSPRGRWPAQVSNLKKELSTTRTFRSRAQNARGESPGRGTTPNNRDGGDGCQRTGARDFDDCHGNGQHITALPEVDGQYRRRFRQCWWTRPSTRNTNHEQ